MTKKLTVIFLLLGNITIAQNKTQPTQFDKFVNKQKIEWAAYANDSFHFVSAGLNGLLIKRLTDNRIKASLPVSSRTAAANGIRYLSKDSIDKLILTPAHKMEPAPDSNGDIQLASFTKKMSTASLYNITEVTQILYVKKGKLKSYIPWVTPTLPLFLSSGKYIGESFYFNTAYNYKYNKKARKKKKLVFLSTTNKMITLSRAESGNSIKEMYGHNLLETLWPMLLKNKVDVFATGTGKKADPEKLDLSVIFDQPAIIPLYDTKGNVFKYETRTKPIDPTKFTGIELIQDWYYDAKRNQVTNTIREAYLYAKIWSARGEAKEATPVLKLVFR